jgi:ribosomal protein S12 methylthiotransferase accessory factor
MGKGFGEQSMASAIAEAIEHYFYQNDNSKVFEREVGINLSPSWFSEGSPNFSEILLDKSIVLDHILLENILHDERVYYPAFLSNPNYLSKNPNQAIDLEKYSLTRYSCNSGIASGLNRSEATLHGLLELIERDAIGMLLLSTIISKKPKAVNIIDNNSLPAGYRKIITQMKFEFGGDVELFDITSEFGIPTVLASLKILNSGALYFGSGSSLFLEYALERALLEAAQCFHAQLKHKLPLPIPPSFSLVNDSPKYVQCYMDRGIFAYQGGEQVVDYSILKNRNHREAEAQHLDAGEQVKYLAKILKLKGIDVYSRVIFDDQNDSGVCVIQVASPKLERFYLLASGLHILPAQRGMLHLRYLEQVAER